ncbi:hypothetical protein [Amycolatopsis taiwanensis]|uniref:Uncharacterized protein n=1 Tax=Amycolatopsis taiwanensis TaxID=342230 RepID=A0A9W6R1U1_9PSEU|nr:hypothetical protein [Amycolatopsis taiwanensis]GLY67171.1 hypothetical protein Atai01_37900 [Amycolatopsis taiwanensis]
MSKEGAGPRQDAETGRPDAGTDTVVPEGRGDVQGISDLTYRIITPYLRHERLHRACFVALVVLAAVCVIASGVRLSPFPLLPLPLLGTAYFGLRRTRSAQGDRGLLVWSAVFLTGILVAFWVMSVIGTHLH